MLARKHSDMAMTNAERQRRYRQKLKARASGDALGDRVREASDRAVAALWAFHERPARAAFAGPTSTDAQPSTTISPNCSAARKPGRGVLCLRA
jgi:hypothetical protein